MSFLSNRYTKEGPGVYLDEPEKGPGALFFSILGRKFWKIVTLNLMYVLFSAPVLILSVIVAPYLLQFMFPGVTPESVQAYIESPDVLNSLVEGITPLEFTNTLMVFMYVLTALFFVSMSLFVLGPVHAGMTYVLRNYSREEHAFLWSDFWEHAKKNAGQSIAAGLIGIVATTAMMVSLGVYRSIIGSDFLKMLVTGFILLLFVLFTVMQMYIYPMMVTFKLTLKNIYKNSFLFFTLRLFPNIGIFLIGIVLNLVIPILLVLFLQLLGFYILIIYYVVIGFGIQLLMTNFFVYRQLDRFMIQRIGEDADNEAIEAEGVTEDVDAFEVESADSVIEEPAPKSDGAAIPGPWKIPGTGENEEDSDKK